MKGKIIEKKELPAGTKFKRSKTLCDAVAYYTIEFDSKKELYDAALRIEDLIVPIIV